MNRLMICILSICAISTLVGCGTQLTKQGSDVKLYYGASVDQMSKCKRLGDLHETQSASNISLYINKDMDNKLRNDAANMGGDSVAITSEQPYEVKGVVYKCNH